MRVEGAAEDIVFRVCGLFEVLALMDIWGGDIDSRSAVCQAYHHCLGDVGLHI